MQFADVAAMLRMKHRWEPVLWVATEPLHEPIAKEFLGAEFHSSHSARLELPISARPDIQPPILDDACLDRFREEDPMRMNGFAANSVLSNDEFSRSITPGDFGPERLRPRSPGTGLRGGPLNVF